MNVKNRNRIIVVLLIFITLVLIRQNGSVKGNWSDSDKHGFKVELENLPEPFSSLLGKNKARFIEYSIESGEKKYSSYAELSNDSDGIQKISKESCIKIILNGSVKGKWSESDKLRFRSQLGKEERVNKLGKYKLIWIECCLSKMEANYSCYIYAIKDLEGGKKFALECNDEIILKNNK